MAYEWMSIVASVIGGLFTIGAVVLAWCLAKKSINKYQQERDENNQRERLMVEFNNLQDKAFRLLVSFNSFKRPFSRTDKFNLESLMNRISDDMFEFRTSKILLINKLKIRITDISEEILEKLDETSSILWSIAKKAKKQIDRKTSIEIGKEEINTLLSILEEIYDVILTSKIN